MLFILYIYYIFAPKTATQLQHSMQIGSKPGNHLLRKNKSSEYMTTTKNTDFLNEYETAAERDRRLRREAICKEYVARSGDILAGGVKPNRVLRLLAEEHLCSIMGVKKILIRAGLYKSGKQPVVLQGIYAPKQTSLF